MKQPHDLVREFHQATSLPHRTVPTVPDAAEIELRIALLREECQEAIEALTALKDASDGEYVARLAHVAKELADVIYVAAGAEVTLGLPGPQVFAEVHRSNMSKLPICITCGGSAMVFRDPRTGDHLPGHCNTCEGTGRGPCPHLRALPDAQRHP